MSDDDIYIQFGAGFLGDPAMKQHMSPERWEAERAAAEKEAAEAAEAAAQAVLDAEAEAAFWARQRGETVPTLAEAHQAVLARYVAAADRADRRDAAKAAQAHSADCGCESCGDRLIGSGLTEPPPPRRLPSIVQKDNVAAEDAFMNQPATVGVVSAMVGNVEAKIARLFGKR